MDSSFAANGITGKLFGPDIDEQSESGTETALQAKLLQSSGCFSSFYSGGKYPRFWDERAVKQLQNEWHPQSGDVFVVSHFPIRGAQRLLVALVEGHEDPWAPGLIDKSHFCDAAASRRGARAFMEEVASWPGRRLFKTHSMPSTFPCAYPFLRPAGVGTPPKIVVLVADPRHAFTIAYNYWKPNFTLAEFVEFLLAGTLNLFGDYFEHSVTWAQEAARYPDQVRLCDAGRLGSLDPKEVKAELEGIANFLEIPVERVLRLVAATFRRPNGQTHDLTLSCCAPTFQSHLIEESASNLHAFEAAISSAAWNVQRSWKQAVETWIVCTSPFLMELARTCMRGVASTPPLVLTIPLRGEALHAAGKCKPCVFMLRNACNNGEFCMYCHEDGHTRTKRPSKKFRDHRRRLSTDRTPSPSPSPRRVNYESTNAVQAYSGPSSTSVCFGLGQPYIIGVQPYMVGTMAMLRVN